MALEVRRVPDRREVAVEWQTTVNSPTLHRSFYLINNLITDERAFLTWYHRDLVGPRSGASPFADMPSWVLGMSWARAAVVNVIQEFLTAFGSSALQVIRCEILFIKLGFRNQSELQLLYQPPCSTVTFLLELLDYISGLAVEFSRFGELQSLGVGSEVAQGCMVTIMTMGLSQINQSLTWDNSQCIYWICCSYVTWIWGNFWCLPCYDQMTSDYHGFLQLYYPLQGGWTIRWGDCFYILVLFVNCPSHAFVRWVAIQIWKIG